MDESQRMMHEKINYLIGKQTVQFSCVDTISPLGSKFDFGDMETEEGHNNSSNGSKGDIATKEFLKRKRGQGLPSKSDETDLNLTNMQKKHATVLKCHMKTATILFMSVCLKRVG